MHLYIPIIVITTFIIFDLGNTGVIKNRHHGLLSVQQRGEFNFLLELEPTLRIISAQNVLEYSDSCSPSSEAHRIKISKSFQSYLSSLDLTATAGYEFYNVMLDIATLLSEIPGTLCNLFKGLECSPILPKCTCMSSNADLIGAKGHFVREGNECKLDIGSTCFDIDATSSMFGLSSSNTKINAKSGFFNCVGNSTCVVKSNGKECTSVASMKELERILALEKVEPSKGFGFILKLFKDGLCVCGPLD